MKRLSMVLFIVSMSFIQVSHAEENNLERKILLMDAALFDAFNGNDIEKIKDIFHKDLEFYHDKGGLADYEATIESLISLLGKPGSPQRSLIAESSAVYPIKDFGAVQTGTHKFCNKAADESQCGFFKFVHLWSEEKSGWKLKRVISYDH